LSEKEDIKKVLASPLTKDQDIDMVKGLIRRIISINFVWNERYTSDFSIDFYYAQGAVTPLLTGHDKENSLR